MNGNNFVVRRMGLACACMLLGFSTVIAQEEEVQPAETSPEELPLNFYVEVGGEYDNNIAVDASDNNSAQGDEALRFRARLGIDLYEEGRDRLTARYSFFQSLHEELTDFDLQIHSFSLRGRTRLGKANLGTTYRYDNISLGGDKFQDVHSIRPDIGVLVAKRTYLTAYYEYRNQQFNNPLLQERDANRHTLSSRLFFLLGKKRNITAGYTIARHNANNNAFTYWGHRLDTSLKLPLGESNLASVFRLRYYYRIRNYDAITPSIGEIREDRRHTARAILEVPITESLQGELEYRFTDAQSNLATVDYTSHTVRVSLGWRF